MGTTSEKLTYLNETKTQLKSMINYGLDENNKITNETTFRDYVKSIFKAFLESLNNPNTLFTNLPKKSQEGANITLNDTANASMKIKLSASEMSQSGTPTPENPQDIHTISGDNKLVVNEKNLANITIIGKVPSLSHGQLVSLGGSACSDYISIDNTKEYTFSFTTNNTAIPYILFYGENNSYLGYSQVNNSGYKLSDSTYYSSSKSVILRFDIYDRYNTIQLEKGPATSYEPCVSQETDINLGVENLWKNQLSGFIPQSGSYPITSSSYPNARYILVNLLAGQSITFSGSTSDLGRVRYIDKDTNQVVGMVNSGETTYYKSTSPFVAGFTEGTIIAKKEVIIGIMDMGGAVNNLVVNYGTKPQTISDNPIEYCKIGNYEDEFIRTSGKNLFVNETGTLTNRSIVMTNNGDEISFVGTNDSATFYPSFIFYADGSVAKSDWWPVTTNIKPEKGYFTDSTIDNIFSMLKTGTYTGDNPTYSIGRETFISNLALGEESRYSNIINAGDEKINFIAIGFRPSQQVNLKIKIMLNEGTTALPYEPYGSNEWYIKKSIGKVILDGSENWTSLGTSGSVYKYYTSNYSSLVTGLPTTTRALSTHFIYAGVISNTNNANSIWFNLSSGATTSNGNLSVSIEDISTANDFKTWLSNNNVILDYVLATPTYTQITGTLAEQLENIYQKLKSFKGTTNISQVNNDLPFVLNVQALENLE